MTQRYVTIGSMVNVHVFDDVDFGYGFQTDGVAYVGSAPTNPNEVLRLTDLPTLGNIVISAAVITDHAIVRGDGGARGIQGSTPTITDAGSILMPNGTAAIPSLGFISNVDVGIYYSPGGTGALNFTINNTNVFSVAETDVSCSVAFRLKNGTVAALSLMFSASPKVGLYRPAHTQLGLVANEKESLRLDDGAVIIGDPVGATNYTQFAADGELTLAGTARVTRSLKLTSEIAKPAATAPTEAVVGNFFVLQYTVGGPAETALLTFHIPEDWDQGTDMNLHIHWAPTTNGAGNVKWDINYAPLASEGNEILTAAGTPLTVTDATQTLQDELLETASVVIVAANIASEDCIGITLSRDNTVGGNYGNTASFVLIEIEYTSDRLGL